MEKYMYRGCCGLNTWECKSNSSIHENAWTDEVYDRSRVDIFHLHNGQQGENHALYICGSL